MPTYDFLCESCQHEYEEMVHSSARDDLRTCPNCGEKKAKRVWRNASSVSYTGKISNLKRAGSGWNDMLTRIKKASARKNTINTR